MAEIILNKEEIDSLAEVCNITFGAAANKLSGIVNASSKIAKPQIIQCKEEVISEVLSAKSVIIRYSGTGGNNVNWSFFIDTECASKFSSKLLNKTVDIADVGSQKEVLEAINNVMNQLMEAALPACNATLGKNIVLNPGEIFYASSEDKVFDFNKEYPEAAVRVQFIFKIQDVFESKLFLLLGVPFAKEMIDAFAQMTLAQTSTMDTSKPTVSARQERESARMQEVLSYCQKIGNFSVIESLQVPVKVRISSKKMRFGELWFQDTGSIINFKKKADEPIEVLFGEKIVALAEVVAIKEKFGVKITEVKR